MFIFIILGIFLLSVGVKQLSLSSDELWERHERGLLARGLSPQRNDVWERNARISGLVAVATGVFSVVLGIVIGLATPQKMSGITMNGRELTQAEWDACGHDVPTCLTQDYMRRH